MLRCFHIHSVIKEHSASPAKKSIFFVLFVVDECLLSFLWNPLETLNSHRSELSCPEQPWFCPAEELDAVPCQKAHWHSKEQHLFYTFPDEKLQLRPPRLPVCISHPKATPCTLILRCLWKGTKITYEFNAFLIEFKCTLTLIFVLHITSVQEIQY